VAELSPAAQAVLHSFWDAPVSPARNCQIAAAIEALVDEIVPEPNDWDKDNFSLQALRLRCVMRDQMLRVVTELRNNNPTSEGDYSP
jgi:hypothetical protein